MRVKDARVADFRNRIYEEVDGFFQKIHDLTDSLHKQKRSEVDEIFKKMKVDDLSDLNKYEELYMNVSKALADMQVHY